MRVSILAGLVLVSSGVVFAQDESEDGWSGTGQLGYVRTTGNSETESVNAQIDLSRLSGPWTWALGLKALGAADSGDTTAERYEFSTKLDRRINEQSYWYGAFRYDDDRFSSYEYQGSLTAGYGRNLIASEKHQLSGEIGAGYRQAKEADTGVKQDDFIGRVFVDYKWVLTETTNFTNVLLVEGGSSNTFTENITGLGVSINSDLALKLGYTIRHNSSVVGGRDKTDTITGVNLVYDF
ncbi:MAG: outer membrane protein [Lysobacteraceae bacterium]|nr:MAG: outer membrane protein [Xanthomonadaceae bacterium]